MTLSDTTRERIQTLLNTHPVLLFMKGSPQQPQCGFSAKASGVLNELLPAYGHVDVLSDPELREGIKLYGQWPTIPQLYVRGELIGGSDIILDLAQSGELHDLLGVAKPDRNPPEVQISAKAAEAISTALADAPQGMGLHLQVDARFNAQFQLKPVSGREIAAEASGISIYFDLDSAQRARGLQIDWVDDERGQGLVINNPNAPPAVNSLSVEEAAQHLKEFIVIDVRPAHARDIAPFPHSHHVLDEDSHDQLAALPKNSRLAFLCHHGVSSRQAAEHFRGLGFTELYNIEGGIDEWSQRVDSQIPRY
jgi:monothiol glutaredoxin